MSINELLHFDDAEEYVVIPVIPMEDAILHTEASPFCNDLTCPCHEDQQAVQAFGTYVEGGPLTPKEADQLYWGKTVGGKHGQAVSLWIALPSGTLAPGNHQPQAVPKQEATVWETGDDAGTD